MSRETPRERAARELRRAQEYIDELEMLVMSQRTTIRKQQAQIRALRNSPRRPLEVVA